MTDYSIRPGIIYHPAEQSKPTIVGLIHRWLERRRQRLQLANLSDYLLKDIGVSRYAAEREASKPFWIE